jgi:hypothetical protein
MTTTIERSVQIPAPIAIVWSTLTDTSRYESWNPFIPEFSGELRPGAEIRIRISPPGGRAMTFTPTVTAVAEGRRLEWLGRLGIPGMFDGRHSFTLEALDPTTTRLVQAERFTGCLVPFTGRLLRRTAAGFEEMNQAIAAEAVERFTAPRQRHS